jgi:hypothetical protein
VKRLLLCLALLAPCAAAAADLHLQAVGTRVSKGFNLGPAIFYLPEGDWVLAAKRAWTGTLQRSLEGPKFASVFLFDVRNGQVARALFASTNIEPVLGARGWLPSEDPCKRREDVYVHRELGPNFLDQYCIEVNHRLPFLTEAKGLRQEAHGWLVTNQVAVPRTVVGVQFARIDKAFQTDLHYYFNPQLDGFAPSAATKWSASEWHRDRVGNDLPRAAYLEALARWAGDAAAPVHDGFKGEKLKGAFPQPPFPAKR